MSQINPFITSIVQAPAVQRQQATDKDVQLKRAAEKQKNAGHTGDQFEHAVESPEELAAIHDEQKEHPDQRRSKHGRHKDDPDTDDEEGEPHLDLTA